MIEPTPYQSDKNQINLEQKLELLAYLKEKLDMDFTDYSESSVRRRISKILTELKLDTVSQYIEYLNNQQNPREAFLEKFTVNVTEMFRDPFFFSCLMKVIKKLAQEKDHINIWSAGCSSGEETLSISILLKENDLLDKVSILGTDVSSTILRHAQSQTYKKRHVDLYEAAYKEAGGNSTLEKYFTVQGENVVFENDLYRSVTFMENDLMTTPPASGFDIIICRNVLIYFNPQLQNSILSKFNACLNPEGYIVLGSKESIVFFQERSLFTEVEPESSIYKKVR